MNMEEVIENELKCVQRNCCRLENECAKCDLVLPIEEIINAYNEALRIKKENAELKAQIEKMKCCGNCEHFNFSEPNYCHKGVYRERQYVCSEWKFGN